MGDPFIFHAFYATSFENSIFGPQGLQEASTCDIGHWMGRYVDSEDFETQFVRYDRYFTFQLFFVYSTTPWGYNWDSRVSLFA
jgi:hypothetical protein